MIPIHYSYSTLHLVLRLLVVPTRSPLKSNKTPCSNRSRPTTSHQLHSTLICLQTTIAIPLPILNKFPWSCCTNIAISYTNWYSYSFLYDHSRHQTQSSPSENTVLEQPLTPINQLQGAVTPHWRSCSDSTPAARVTMDPPWMATTWFPQLAPLVVPRHALLANSRSFSRSSTRKCSSSWGQAWWLMVNDGYPQRVIMMADGQWWWTIY